MSVTMTNSNGWLGNFEKNSRIVELFVDKSQSSSNIYSYRVTFVLVNDSYKMDRGHLAEVPRLTIHKEAYTLFMP